MKKNITALHLSNMETHRLTKEAIQEALFNLLQQKDFDEITITEIINRSGVSRTAFYKNYKSKDEIIIDGLDSLIMEIADLMKYTNSYTERLNIMYTFFLPNRDRLKLLVNSRYCSEILNRANRITINDSMTPKQRFYTLLWNGALYNFFVEWMKNDNQETLPELLELVEGINNTITLPEEI